MKGNETICGRKIRCYKTHGEIFPYFIVLMDSNLGPLWVNHHDMLLVKHDYISWGITHFGHAEVGKRVKFSDLPEDSQSAIKLLFGVEDGLEKTSPRS